MEEIFDIFTREGKYLGTAPKSECHSGSANFYHKPVWIWIINSKGEILIQKRAKTKKNFPDLWDMPSAGHVSTGEKIIDGAVRETYEELGVETNKDDYEFLLEYIYEQGKELAQVYLLKLDMDINDFKLQENEVQSIKWVSYDMFKKILYSDEFVPLDNEYKDIILDIIQKRIK